MKQITPFLWFNGRVEEALILYISLFAKSRINYMQKDEKGEVRMANITLNGSEFMLFNGGSEFKFNEAVSLFVNCADQAEVDKFWNALIADGGQEGQCGWLKDKFGVSWQIIPKQLGELLGNENPEVAGKAMQAMLKMKKIIVADLK